MFFHKGRDDYGSYTQASKSKWRMVLQKQFGTSCEVVIHDLNKDLETSIVHIENGQVTHRKSGDGPSGIVLETLHKKRCQSTR